MLAAVPGCGRQPDGEEGSHPLFVQQGEELLRLRDRSQPGRDIGLLGELRDAAKHGEIHIHGFVGRRHDEKEILDRFAVDGLVLDSLGAVPVREAYATHHYRPAVGDGDTAADSSGPEALSPLKGAQQRFGGDIAHLEQPDQLAQDIVARAALEGQTDRPRGEEVFELHGGRTYPLAAGRVNKYFHPMQLPYLSADSFALVLAPMAGVSEAPFRQICRAMGADVVLSEFLSSEAIRRRIRNTLEGAEFEECERPIGIQIYGADPNAMAEAAGLIGEHYQPEFIDINFGCPVKKVVQRNGGSGCLRDLELVERIIRAVRGATHLPVTVKTRSGWNDEYRDPVGIALRMQDAGAQAFTLHARTRTQMFSGRADWDEIARVVEALDIPVLGNGDIQSSDDVVRMRAHTGCAGVMVGRGAFGNPWLFRDAQALLAGRSAARRA